MKDWDNEDIFKEYLKKANFNEFSIYFGNGSIKQMYLTEGIVKISHNGWSSTLMDSSPYVRQRFLSEMKKQLK